MEKLRFFALGFFLSCFVLIVSVAKLFRAQDILGTADSLMAVLITLWIKNNQVILQGFNVGEKICFWVGFYVVLFLVNFFKLTKIQLREPEPAGSDGTSLENPAGVSQGAQATTTAPEGGGEPGNFELARVGGGEIQAPGKEEDEGARDPAGSDGTSLLENPAGVSQGAQATTTAPEGGSEPGKFELARVGGGEKQAPGKEEDGAARDPAGSDGTSLENPAGGSQGAQATTTVGNQLAIGSGE
ncbi:hypothetical protein ARALYDRAFT_896762 [Arabidopsis lyrata subsp. lyrata]|uniref:Uncharacterized protein n=1 Tax=Arabidopsis lyrata subsp. lyrata TaxID=81972 RepID=D7L5H1_ARALL|nr:hypothetical protein ARALYDRAFT_896762 [Arabidopsis lyrata subsp. lyrata]